MLMSSLASIQAGSVYTTSTVPIEQTYGLPASSKTGAAGAGATPPTRDGDDGASPGPATKTEGGTPEPSTETGQAKPDDNSTASAGTIKTEPKD
ncbi:hypothetical protein ISF_07825 [Cordyceps fumosorosea ARSEF 2679]|uniref:Uncharacterized protein n=1 Tax=Cordyceps fumosorosea (strain ARSEF 2679) TaxID=1081104 RepID=A0A162MGC1_CORFA|nr:hypothetical protein ISF_07825 [Cordyceps fumosorosea ARSEF 2679]OAA55720.1 hypothetical protein ISF_07825 [Cordyceps fumosorosea ARSEF 2679]